MEKTLCGMSVRLQIKKIVVFFINFQLKFNWKVSDVFFRYGIFPFILKLIAAIFPPEYVFFTDDIRDVKNIKSAVLLAPTNPINVQKNGIILLLMYNIIKLSVSTHFYACMNSGFPILKLCREEALWVRANPTRK